MSLTSIEEQVSPSESVVEAVAAREGIDPMDIDVPLYYSVDPDALDRLVRSSHSALSVNFTDHDYEVAVSSDGSVDVSRAE